MQTTDFILANKRHLKQHEDIIVFYKHQPIYNPQMTIKQKPLDNTNWKNDKKGSDHKNFSSKEVKRGIKTQSYPKSIIVFNSTQAECNNTKRIHPTQKPVPLFEYLIRTYTNEGDTVLDNCAGSGTSGVACENTGRNSILIEREPKYCNIIRERMNALQGRLIM